MLETHSVLCLAVQGRLSGHLSGAGLGLWEA